MKKLFTALLFTFTFSLLPSLCKAQANVYHHFPDSNAVWSEDSENCTCGGIGCDDWTYAYVLKGDTMYGGKTYHKVYKNGGTYTPGCSGNFNTYWIYSYTYFASYREDTLKHVYAWTNGNEVMLYDFNLKKGDTLKTYTAQTYLAPQIVHSIDSIYIWGNYRKRYNISIRGDTGWNSDYPQIIEGIGCTEGLFDPMISFFEIGIHLDCFTQDDSTWSPFNGQFPCGPYPLGIENVRVPGIKTTLEPNPNNGIFTILSSGNSKSSVEIYNVYLVKIY